MPAFGCPDLGAVLTRAEEDLTAVRSDAVEQDLLFRQAEARIAALTQEAQGATTQAEAAAAEARLNLNPITTRLVEARLRQLGLDPGAVDGQIDENTRRALRRYQRARDLPVTGYLSEQTLVRLLADSIGTVGR